MSETPTQDTEMPHIGSYTVATLEVPPSIFQMIQDKLLSASYGSAFIQPRSIDLSGVAMVPKEGEEWHLSSDRVAAVGHIPFLPITKDTPRAKCLLLGPGLMPTIANYDGDPQWVGWFPMPFIPESMR